MSVLEGSHRRAIKLPNGATLLIKGVGVKRWHAQSDEHRLASLLVTYGWPPGADPDTDDYVYRRAWSIKLWRPWTRWSEFSFYGGMGSLADLGDPERTPPTPSATGDREAMDE